LSHLSYPVDSLLNQHPCNYPRNAAENIIEKKLHLTEQFTCKKLFISYISALNKNDEQNFYFSCTLINLEVFFLNKVKLKTSPPVIL
jgi:hypothetical protein